LEKFFGHNWTGLTPEQGNLKIPEEFFNGFGERNARKQPNSAETPEGKGPPNLLKEQTFGGTQKQTETREWVREH